MLAVAGARLVVGCDMSADALSCARRQYGSDAVHFVTGDGTRLPFADACFDAVVSFETGLLAKRIPATARFVGCR